MNPPAMKVTFWNRYDADTGDAELADRQVDDTYRAETASRSIFFLIG
jgi:hypothetical protein